MQCLTCHSRKVTHMLSANPQYTEAIADTTTSPRRQTLQLPVSMPPVDHVQACQTSVHCPDHRRSILYTWHASYVQPDTCVISTTCVISALLTVEHAASSDKPC